jgi:hypothetical protein
VLLLVDIVSLVTESSEEDMIEDEVMSSWTQLRPAYSLLVAVVMGFNL